MDDRDLIDGDAEPVSDELREGRLMALAVAVRSRQHLDGADRIDATSADSHRPTPAPSEPTALDGAMPQASM
jgi:hypothetical protein